MNVTHLAVIATVPEREALLQQALDSLIHQTPVEVYLNEDWGTMPGDYGKFAWLGKADCDFYFTCDDDLVYPPDYCALMSRYSYEYDAVVTLHGNTYIGSVQDSFYKGLMQKYRCLTEVKDAAYVDVPGSGVTCIPKRLHKPLADAMPECRAPNAADLHLAIALKRLDEQAIVIPHPAGWMKQLPIPERTIYNDIMGPAKPDESLQLDMLSEVLG